jgi:hypothetical protein
VKNILENYIFLPFSIFPIFIHYWNTGQNSQSKTNKRIANIKSWYSRFLTVCIVYLSFLHLSTLCPDATYSELSWLKSDFCCVAMIAYSRICEHMVVNPLTS